MHAISTPTVHTESDFDLLPLKLAYSFLEANNLVNEGTSIRTSHEKIGAHSTSTSRRTKIVALLREKGLLQRFIDTNWRNGSTPAGKKQLDRFDKVYDEYRRGVSSPVEPEIKEDTEASSEFALEAHLRDYLAENLGMLESGLSLWPVENEEDAVEFRVDDEGRRVDILAKDRDGVPVVIELKVSRGHERTIGQALYYRAKVKKQFSASRVRIFIVSAEISPELRAASSELPDTQLFEYSLSMKIMPVQI
jgi:Endonuclease NucS